LRLVLTVAENRGFPSQFNILAGRGGGHNAGRLQA
jgi:hypothetical protein